MNPSFDRTEKRQLNSHLHPRISQPPKRFRNPCLSGCKGQLNLYPITKNHSTLFEKNQCQKLSTGNFKLTKCKKCDRIFSYPNFPNHTKLTKLFYRDGIQSVALFGGVDTVEQPCEFFCMHRGYIKLWRKIEDDDMWFEEPFTPGQAWVDMLLLANHKEKTFSVRGNLVTIKRGQIGYSEATLGKRWKWSRGRVRRYLLRLNLIQQIEQHKSPVLTVISIIKYDLYQPNGTTDDTTERQQTVQQKDTNKNVKNDKNVKKVSILQPEAAANIQKLFDILYEINPTLNFGNITQRNAAKRLIDRLGPEKAFGSAQAAVAVHGKQYAPTITTPLQLESKLSQLVAFYKKEGGSHVIITDPNL